ncbi:DNA-binding protein K10-like [Chenopodium quinoa]|uniref:DNA-binding protein K10-like n=1 Tax=Chenopodium quinoa TaxID=63459 RepID=UPI000B784802|nr:DNA-binding protein K10-like [Chenopodium quinoa]
MLADQLANVGAKVSDPRLVITLVCGLPKAYDNVATLLQQADPPISFQKARSMLTLEESRQANQASHEAQASSSALFATGNPPSHHDSHINHDHRNHQKQNNNNNTRGGNRGGNGKGRSGGGGHHGKGRGGRGSGQQQHQQMHSHPPQWSSPLHWQYSPWAAYAPPPWAIPPCPYPTASWARQTNGPRPPQNGILGPRPQQHHQAFTAQAPSSVGYAPTDVEAALHTLSLAPPDDNWYMDTRATSHMTSNQGPPDGDHPYEM